MGYLWEGENDYDEDKPIKRKKKRGPKGEGKVKVSYILILRRSLGGFGRLWEHFGRMKIIMIKTNPSNITRKEVLREKAKLSKLYFDTYRRSLGGFGSSLGA